MLSLYSFIYPSAQWILTHCVYTVVDITMNDFSHEQKQILTLNSLLLKYVGSNLNSFTYAFFRSPGKKII